jgi:hypothetical protein
MNFRLWLETMHVDTAARMLASYTLDSIKSGKHTFQIWPGREGDEIEKALAKYPYLSGAAIQVIVNEAWDKDFNRRAEKSFSLGRHFHVEARYTLLRGDEGVYPMIRVMIVLKEMKEQDYSEFYYELLDSLRHEMEHVDDFRNNIDRLKKVSGRTSNALAYFTAPHEIRAHVSAIYLVAKKQRKPFGEVMAKYLQDILKRTRLTSLDVEKISNKWSDYALGRYPDAK